MHSSQRMIQEIEDEKAFTFFLMLFKAAHHLHVCIIKLFMSLMLRESIWSSVIFDVFFDFDFLMYQNKTLLSQ